MPFWSVTREQYEADREHLRSTWLKDFILEGPWYYHDKYIANTLSDKQTDDLLLGMMVHEFILEGKSRWSVYDGVRRGDRWEQFERDCVASGAVPVTRRMNEQLNGMREAVFRNSEARRLIESDGMHEQPIEWNEPYGKFAISSKCLLDRLQHDGTVADLKTAHDASPDGFFRQKINLGYHISAAWYERGRASILGEVKAPFIHIAVSKSEPFRCVCYAMQDELLAVARRDIASGLEQLAECRESGVWPDRLADKVVYHPVPRWFLWENGYGVG